jgi:hypothetical protein
MMVMIKSMGLCLNDWQYYSTKLGAIIIGFTASYANKLERITSTVHCGLLLEG